MTSLNEGSCELFASPGLTSSSSGENYVILLFSECPFCIVDGIERPDSFEGRRFSELWNWISFIDKTEVRVESGQRQKTILLVPWTKNHLSSFKCGFLDSFSRQSLLRSLSSLLFLLRWNKYGAKKCLKNHIPFDF